MTLKQQLARFRPSIGRLSKEQALHFRIADSIGFIGAGPVVLIFNLPSALKKPDVPVVDAADLFRLNREACRMGNAP